MPPETIEEKAARRQQYIDRGEICEYATCPYPEEHPEGWCNNCGYPLTEATRASWQSFLPVDSQHKILIDKLLNR